MQATRTVPDAEKTLEPVVPDHVPLAVQTRGGLIESVHYGSLICIDAQGRTLRSLGDPLNRIYPRSALKPLQAVAMVRAGLRLPPDQLAMAAASHSGAAIHQETARARESRGKLRRPFVADLSSVAVGWLACLRPSR